MVAAPAGTQNLHQNPSVEVSTSGYSSGANGSITHETTGGYSGSRFVRYTAATASGSVATRVASTCPGLVVGQTYTFSAWVRTDGAATIRLSVLTPGGSPAFTNGPNVNLLANTWTRASLTVTIPVGTSSVSLAVQRTVSIGNLLDVDALQVSAGSTLWDYYDGSSLNSVWDGVANASTSTYLGTTGTTSAYMPDVKVEIAFDSGYATAAGSRTWTDVSKYVELTQGITINRGRLDEFAVADPNKLTLTLDNSDGRFTAGKTTGAYYPNVKIGRPIRVTSTPVGGTPSIRFVGYVDEWPNEWNGSDNYATAKITASSRMARLGFDAEAHSVIEEEYLLDTPINYWTMGDPAGATSAADSSATPTAGPLVATGQGDPIVFGTAIGPATDSLTAAIIPGQDFANRQQYLRGPYVPAGWAAATVETFIQTPAAGRLVSIINTESNLIGLGLRTNIGGSVSAYFAEPGLSGTATSSGNVFDGKTHHLAATLDGSGGTLRLYIDGVLAASTAVTDITGWNKSQTFVGWAVDPATEAIQYGQGTFAHVAVYDKALSATRIAAHAAAGLSGYSTDTASDRIGRYAAFAGVPAAEYAGDAGTNRVSPIDTTGVTVIENMRRVEETEAGVLFDARDNTLTFHGRARRYNAAIAMTFDAAAHEIENGIAPKLDRSALVNDVTATADDESTTRATNATSITDYGYARATIAVAAPPDVALQAASWQVSVYGQPKARIPSLPIDLLPLSQARQDALFALDISSRVGLISMPSQAESSSIDFFIEGYTETISKVAYDFDFNVSPTTGFDVFTLGVTALGDPTRPLAY